MGGWVPDWPGWWEAGLVWVWTGEGRIPEVPNFSRPPAGHLIHAEIEVNPPPPQPPPAAADRLQPAPLCRRRLMLACSSLKTFFRAPAADLLQGTGSYLSKGRRQLSRMARPVELQANGAQFPSAHPAATSLLA